MRLTKKQLKTLVEVLLNEDVKEQKSWKGLEGKYKARYINFHKLKDEVFYIQSGKVVVRYSSNDDIGRASKKILGPGDNFHVYRGLRHQIEALEDTELFEFSTQHFDSDSHRIIKGD